MASEAQLPNNSLLSITRTQLTQLNFFWIGYIIYSFCYSLIETSYVNYKLFQGFQLMGIFLVFFCGSQLVRVKIDNDYLRITYSLYYLWILLMLITGYNLFLNYEFLKNFLLNQSYGGLIYFAPLILLFPKTIPFYSKILDIIFIFCLFYIIYDIIFLKDLLNSDRSSLRSQAIVEISTDLSFSSGFLLLTYAYNSNKKNIIAIVTIILTLLFAIIRARRGLIMMSLLIIIFAYILFLSTSNKKSLIIYLSILFVLAIGIYATAMYKPEEGIFGFLMERGAEDTRTGVEEYFYADMKGKDWIIGRGINGEYFCPNIEKDLPTNYRSVIETGYLQIILKGGLISLFLYLFITVPAIFLGLFKSKNILTKAAALWILFALISLYPTQVNTFTLRFLLVWVSIGICYSKKIRNIPEVIMKEHFIS